MYKQYDIIMIYKKLTCFKQKMHLQELRDLQNNNLFLFNIINYAAAAAAKLLQLCPTLGPYRQQPTRLPVPGSLHKNTGVGCHFLLQCMKVKSESEVAQSCPT